MGEDMRTADVPELMALWEAFGSRSTWKRAADRGADPELVSSALAELPDVDALGALQANARLVSLLTSRRRYVIQEARDAGASWSDIGGALGMTKQGAQDWYRRKIAEREQVVPDAHDDVTARAVLGGRAE